MDANGGIKVGLGGTHPESDGKALGDLTGIWRQDMQANHFFLQHPNSKENPAKICQSTKEFLAPLSTHSFVLNPSMQANHFDY